MTEYTKEEPNTIASMFNKIAPQYDMANSLMSMNMHKGWNRKLVEAVLKTLSPKRYLDLCAGTGEIAFELLKKMDEECETFLLDFSEAMLLVAKEKAAKSEKFQQNFHTIQADAQEIPLPSESIDAITIAYGIRNVQNPKKCIQEVYRVLRKGGVFAILELTCPKNPLMKIGHKFYMKTFLPLIGKFAASDSSAYQYLCNSIQTFLPPEEIEQALAEQGFEKTSITSLSGGIATIIQAVK